MTKKNKDRKKATVDLPCGCRIIISTFSYGFVNTCKKHQKTDIDRILNSVRLILTVNPSVEKTVLKELDKIIAKNNKEIETYDEPCCNWNCDTGVFNYYCTWHTFTEIELPKLKKKMGL